MLLFKKKFLEDIRAGRKTQTIRVWKFRHMRRGQLSYTPGVGYIEITEVEPVKLEELTDADALPDGFASVEDLRQEIWRLYTPEQLQERKVFRIRFRVLSPEEQLKLRQQRHKRRQTSTPSKERGS